jgi:hypothetical protein
MMQIYSRTPRRKNETLSRTEIALLQLHTPEYLDREDEIARTNYDPQFIQALAALTSHTDYKKVIWFIPLQEFELVLACDAI